MSALGALLLTCALVPIADARQNSTSNSTSAAKPTTQSTSKTHSTKHHSRRKRSARLRGQKKIDGDRAREIQEALIGQHYLSGEPTGTWNQASEDAMRRYQADHGWQTKEVPDSRALISLGLGPSKDHLLNPESAMTTNPPPQPAAPTTASPNTPAATPAQNDPSRPQ